jgi:hypothetical protein
VIKSLSAKAFSRPDFRREAMTLRKCDEVGRIRLAAPTR